MLRYKLHTLLIVLAASAALLGCGRESKVEQIQRGAANVDRHAKEIEQATESPP
jgi:hypothetical protein